MGREQQVPTSHRGPAHAAVLTTRKEEAGWRARGEVPAPGTDEEEEPKFE